MYRTDKQFMKNPATFGARIYIGALAKTVIADDLETKFKVHGTIVGLSLNSGFAFIQYEHEHEAQSAIKNENNTVMQGRKIVVKQAMDKSKPGTNQGPPQRGPPPRQSGPPQRPAPAPVAPQKQGLLLSPQRQDPPKIGVTSAKQNSSSPEQTPPPPQALGPLPSKNQSDLKFQIPEKNQDFQDENMDDDRPNIRPPGPTQLNDERARKGGRKIGRDVGRDSGRDRDVGRDAGRDIGRGGGRGRSNDRERFADRFEPPPKMDVRMDVPRDVYRDREQFYGRDNREFPPPPRGESFAPLIIEPPPPVVEKNDCEIIVVAKALTEYAEFIEQKLKNLGLVVDLLFPNEDVPIGKVLANISSRGCLYAILVMPINEEHRSLTLNILHGLPQEHRNMPIDDAMILISRNLESYMKGEHIPTEQGQMTLLDRHTPQIQMMINLLAENRQLSTPQYDKIIAYLHQKRELQHEYEVAEGISPDMEPQDPKQAELQSRIMNILNKSTSDSPIPNSITAPDPPLVAPTSEPTPILADPTVQKALDSLMLGDMFKNITA